MWAADTAAVKYWQPSIGDESTTKALGMLVMLMPLGDFVPLPRFVRANQSKTTDVLARTKALMSKIMQHFGRGVEVLSANNILTTGSQVKIADSEALELGDFSGGEDAIIHRRIQEIEAELARDGKEEKKEHKLLPTTTTTTTASRTATGGFFSHRPGQQLTLQEPQTDTSLLIWEDSGKLRWHLSGKTSQAKMDRIVQRLRTLSHGLGLQL
jgi:hypothetical protein